MKKVYTFFAAVLAATSMLMAQTGVTGCNDPNGGIQVIFDEAANCNAGALAGIDAVGFHSGMNGWMNVVDWNAPGAVTGTNDGNDDYIVYLADVDAYYGQAAGTVTRLDFVFNQGPAAPDDPWSAEGKMDDGNGGCADFFLELANVTETCDVSASTRDLLLDVDFVVHGNPFTDKVVVSFDNEDGDQFTVALTDAMGRQVRTYNNVNGYQLEVNRGNLAAGFYYLTFTNQAGKLATLKLFAQ